MLSLFVSATKNTFIGQHILFLLSLAVYLTLLLFWYNRAVVGYSLSLRLTCWLDSLPSCCWQYHKRPSAPLISELSLSVLTVEYIFDRFLYSVRVKVLQWSLLILISCTGFWQQQHNARSAPMIMRGIMRAGQHKLFTFRLSLRASVTRPVSGNHGSVSRWTAMGVSTLVNLPVLAHSRKLAITASFISFLLHMAFMSDLSPPVFNGFNNSFQALVRMSVKKNYSYLNYCLSVLSLHDKKLSVQS